MNYSTRLSANIQENINDSTICGQPNIFGPDDTRTVEVTRTRRQVCTLGDALLLDAEIAEYHARRVVPGTRQAEPITKGLSGNTRDRGTGFEKGALVVAEAVVPWLTVRPGSPDGIL